MKDKSEIPGTRETPSGAPAAQSSRTLNSALQQTFESLLREPIPEKLQDLITRIREEEMRKASDSGKKGNRQD